MSKVVHARLDPPSLALLTELRRRTGLSDSELLRRGLAALEAQLPARRARCILGLGKFASGKPDLGSNKSHLEGFGAS